jgi:large subunit ribosomal protein L9
MDLILLQKVQNLGNLGDRVNVKAGFGRNFLVPTGRAVPATKTNIEAFEIKRAEYEKRAAEIFGAADARKLVLDGKSVTLKANASTEGKLYGSVGAREIADAFTAAGMPLSKAEVEMGAGPIRRIGEFDVPVHLHADIVATVKVIVEADV